VVAVFDNEEVNSVGRFMNSEAVKCAMTSIRLICNIFVDIFGFYCSKASSLYRYADTRMQR
jgi:hypothetical protein